MLIDNDFDVTVSFYEWTQDFEALHDRKISLYVVDTFVDIVLLHVTWLENLYQLVHSVVGEITRVRLAVQNYFPQEINALVFEFYQVLRLHVLTPLFLSAGSDYLEEQVQLFCVDAIASRDQSQDLAHKV